MKALTLKKAIQRELKDPEFKELYKAEDAKMKLEEKK